MSTNNSLTDLEILRGSENAPWMFGMLVDRYQPAFLRRGIEILKSRDSAEDAVQETFVRIYKYAHKFSEKENAKFSSWAYKILTNTCYSHAMKRSRDAGRTKSVEFADLDTYGEASFLEHKEQSSLVTSTLDRLPIRFSRLLKLYFFEEKSYEEIAALENISLSAVRSGLYRARKQFKDTALKMTC